MTRQAERGDAASLSAVRGGAAEGSRGQLGAPEGQGNVLVEHGIQYFEAESDNEDTISGRLELGDGNREFRADAETSISSTS